MGDPTRSALAVWQRAVRLAVVPCLCLLVQGCYGIFDNPYREFYRKYALPAAPGALADPAREVTVVDAGADSRLVATGYLPMGYAIIGTAKFIMPASAGALPELGLAKSYTHYRGAELLVAGSQPAGMQVIATEIHEPRESTTYVDGTRKENGKRVPYSEVRTTYEDEITTRYDTVPALRTEAFMLARRLGEHPGVRLLPRGGPPGSPFLIAEVAPGSAAERAGVAPGDFVARVDGLMAVTSDDFTDLVDRLTVPRARPVEVTIVRGGFVRVWHLPATSNAAAASS